MASRRSSSEAAGSLGRPEVDQIRGVAISLLGSGLYEAQHHAESLSVREAELAMVRRFGGPEEHMLGLKGNIAATYAALGRLEEAVLVSLFYLYSTASRLAGRRAE